LHVEETGVGRKMREIDGLRQQEHRRCRQKRAACERNDCTDGASAGRVVTIIAGRLVLPRGLFGGSLGKNGFGTSRSHFRRRCPGRRCCLYCEGMEMPERQRKLEDERQQRQPRAKFEALSKPIHAALRLPGPPRHPSRPKRYFITWGTDCNVNS